LTYYEVGWEMRSKISVLLVACMALLLSAFQNCGSTSPDVIFSQSSGKLNNETNQSDDSGRPYDGKVFLLSGDVCPDGTRIHARIVLHDSSSADLVRNECKEIAPIALGPNEFQLNPNSASELRFQNQTFLNVLIGIKLNMSMVSHEIGYCYWIEYNFGTSADRTTLETQSRLQIYEDGKPLGPAHAAHVDIRNIGLGLFSHWEGVNSGLRFSASDNSDPLTNGRTYTWEIK
jgi:hypothetical protein